jgi:hypothetical protein
MFKKCYWTYFLIYESLKVALNSYFEIYLLNCHENHLESYILSQSTRSLTTNIWFCILENLEALEIWKIILNPLQQHYKAYLWLRCIIVICNNWFFCYITKGVKIKLVYCFILILYFHFCHVANMWVNFINQTTYMQRCQIYLGMYLHLTLFHLKMWV